MTYDDELRAVADLLGSATDVALACHVNPDGDALGSMIALHCILRERGVATTPSHPEPFVLSTRFRILPGLDQLVKPGTFPSRPDVMVTFDCGSLDRLGSLQPSATAAHALVNIDHHVSNTRFGTHNLVRVDAAASAQVVYELVRGAGWTITRDSAFCLYVGLSTDTGRFQYSNTTKAVFEMAADLARFDLPIDEISRVMFEEDSFAYLRLLGDVLRGMELDPTVGLVSAVLRLEDLRRHEVSMEATDSLIDSIRRAAEADVACVVKEQGDGTSRVSLRSLGRVDVCAIASRGGGGGHERAAGFTFTGSPDDALAWVKGALPPT
jgi:bifunctional oligoribonuclease and PAP phosphatase NrnA